jgi:dipeptidase E
VRLYLSSFRMGDHPEHLLALIGTGSRRAVVIANAMDDAPPEVRGAGVDRELAALADLGLDAAELDLRGYFGEQQRLRHELAGAADLRLAAALGWAGADG